MKFLTAFASPNLSASQVASRALEEAEAELAGMPARIKTAQLVLAENADMSDEEHVAAVAELEALRRAEDRLQKRIVKAREARDQALQDEAMAALAGRRDAANKCHPAYAKLVTKYEKEAAALTATVAEMQAIEEEIAAVNREIAAATKTFPDRAHPALVPTPDEVHRVEADIVDPDRTVSEDRVMRKLPRYNEDDAERWEPAGVTQRVGGKLILGPGEAIRRVERVIPGKRTPGRRISSPTNELVLPPARVGAPKLWPKDS